MASATLGAMPYRRGLRRVVGGAAVPYGYTVVTYTSGGVVVEAHGAPDPTSAALYLLGAALGFAVVALVGGHRLHDPGSELDRLEVGIASAAAAAVGLGVSALTVQVVDGRAAFGVVAFLATFTYFVVGAAGTSLISAQPPS